MNHYSINNRAERNSIQENEKVVSAVNHASAQYGNALERLGAENDIMEFYLAQEDIELIHNDMCYRYGGSLGIRDAALLESVCRAPYQSVFGQDLYPTAFDKAAKYLFDFSNYQIFLDGNKRTGLATAAAYLIGSGYQLTLTQMQMYDLTMKIANGQIRDTDQISMILQTHCDLGHILYTKEEEEEQER